jgi:type III secretion protein V
VLVTFSAGIVVTRVASEDARSTVGADIGRQLLRDPKPLILASGLLLVLAFALGLMGTWAALPMGLVGAVLGLGALSIRRSQLAEAREETERLAMAGEFDERDELPLTYAVPLSVVVSAELTHLVDSQTESGARFRAELPRLRSAIYYELGVMLPNVFVAGDAPLKPDNYFIAIKEVPVAFGALKPDCVYVNDSAENIKIFGLDGEDMRNPADQSPGAWVPAAQLRAAEVAGLTVRGPAEVILLHLAYVLKKHAHEFVGVQETQSYLDFASQGMPKLVEEVVPKLISVPQFAEMLQRLVQEGVSIRDIKSILDALSEGARAEKDMSMLAEHVRCALSRQITYRFTGDTDTLYYYMLDDEIQDIVAAGVKRAPTGVTSFNLAPALTHSILAALRREVGDLPATAQKPVLVTRKTLRRYVRNLVEREFPNLTVLSFEELKPGLNFQPVKRISISPERTEVFAAARDMVGPAAPPPNALPSNS